ncbi:hypothetical protein [Kibdelosporangium phytohabitans]|uniref:DUF1795 domain-containing protein n=1 Tax=Kibdelosporangium phytohabitans TaxID=860235 RepID=A0A0N7F4W0_9PSEU|nr:hypothetical protein [Kibdelosporangium phytohabitans]ALG12527.1 hypothetical protein AOZ06_41745 [Kibdelosporangium phytohabitans]MBE1464130.1 hypothetical protein [Kibdelosporangium phytohabitans]
MATTIPVPIEFSLPTGWQAAPPDEVGSPNVAFVALKPPAVNGFTSNITISGEVRPDVPLTDIADEALAKLQAEVAQMKVGKRSEHGTPENPGLTQAVRMLIVANGRQMDVAQLQVFLGMQDVRNPQQQAVLHLVLTADSDEFERVVSDFQQFIETVRPDTGAQNNNGGYR